MDASDTGVEAVYVAAFAGRPHNHNMVISVSHVDEDVICETGQRESHTVTHACAASGLILGEILCLERGVQILNHLVFSFFWHNVKATVLVAIL